jgi:hypothetical protein
MAKQGEVTRLCPNCGCALHRTDELRGRCKCGQHLVSLSGRWGAWDNDTTESIEALGDPGQWVEFDEPPIAGDRDVGGKPDDFYDRGDDVHSDVW